MLLVFLLNVLLLHLKFFSLRVSCYLLHSTIVVYKRLALVHGDYLYGGQWQRCYCIKENEESRNVTTTTGLICHSTSALAWVQLPSERNVSLVANTCQCLPLALWTTLQLVTIQIFTDCHFFIAIPTHLISFGPFVEFLSCMQAKLKVVRSQNISQKGKIWKLKIDNNSHFLIFKKTNTSFYFSCRKLVKDRG